MHIDNEVKRWNVTLATFVNFCHAFDTSEPNKHAFFSYTRHLNSSVTAGCVGKQSVTTAT